jgi:protoporphyrinogen oxidase
MPRQIKVAVIGAGAAGLAAAYDLGRAGHSVVVFEAGDRVGGLAAGFKAEHWDWTLEKFYHHWFASDRHILDLIRELGASERVLFPRPVTAVYYQGRFYPFDSPKSWLSFPGFSWVDAIRFGLVGLYLKLLPSGLPLEKYTAHEWLSRRLGERCYKLLWEPLLVGKFGERYARSVNMAWFWARVKARTPRLGSFVGGFQAFLDLLAERVTREGAAVRLGAAILGIKPEPGGGLVLSTPEGPAAFDHCIATTSPRLLARLAPELPEDYRSQLTSLQSMGAVVVILALDRRLTDYYWHNLPKEAGFPYLAMVEHTNFLPREHYGGDHLIYCGDYLEPDHEYFRLEKEELVARFLPSLRRFNPAFDPSWVKQSWLWRTEYAQPVPLVDHSRRIPSIRTPIRGLWLASMSQVYPWDRGTNFAVEIGRRTARMLLEEVGQACSP